MRLFLAGGITGNLFPYWKNVAKLMVGKPITEAQEEGMKLFLAGGERRHWLQEGLTKEDDMKLYLAGTMCGNQSRAIQYLGGADLERNRLLTEHRPYILESFFYADQDTERLIPYFGDFLLDSGAFTFMQGTKGAVNWDEYIERYADFINRNRIEKFFELDVDSVVGYEKVLQFRAKLERLTGRQCIPVWHLKRGMTEYRRHCDEYPYVAIGGIVSKEIKPEQYKHFPAMITEAHRRGAKVHGLGFTALSYLPRIHFDSVDSTAWTTGNRFGFVYHFDGKTMRKHDAPKGHRINDARSAALVNYTEWIKFQKYAEAHL